MKCIITMLLVVCLYFLAHFINGVIYGLYEEDYTEFISFMAGIFSVVLGLMILK